MLSSFSISPRDVFDILSTLKPEKAPGSDDLLLRLLRFCARGISASLAKLFNLSFSGGEFPTMWKRALVVPLFKKESLSELGNYRPIALLAILSKVFEKKCSQKVIKSS